MTSDGPQFLAVTLDKNTNLQREWERERERERESGFYSHKGAGGQMNIRPSKLATIFRALAHRVVHEMLTTIFTFFWQSDLDFAKKFNDTIPEPLPIYFKSFVTIFTTVFP